MGIFGMKTAYYPEPFFDLDYENSNQPYSPWEAQHSGESAINDSLANRQWGWTKVGNEPRTVQNWDTMFYHPTPAKSPLFINNLFHFLKTQKKSDFISEIMNSTDQIKTLRVIPEDIFPELLLCSRNLDKRHILFETEENSTPWTVITPTDSKKVVKPLPTAGIILVSDAENFAKQNKLEEYIDLAINNIRTIFNNVGIISIDKIIDPDSNEEWITLKFQAEGNTDLLLNKYDKLVRMWIKSVPWPQRSMIRISLEPA
jgi:hypothetical protein